MQNSVVLMLSLLFVKISGLLFKLPIVSLIGATGYGYFNSAYSIYLPVYVLALTGFPAAVSRFVAAEHSMGNYKNIRMIHKVSLYFFVFIGLLGTAFLAVGADFLSSAVKNPNAAPALLVLSPIVFFCCLMSVYRGYYSGLSNLYPSAISQAIEALCKLVVGVGATYFMLQYGLERFEETGEVFGTAAQTREEAISLLSPYAAAAAIFGVSFGAIVACAYIILRHKILGDGITRDQLDSPEQSVLSSKAVLKKILRVGIPISLGAGVMQLSSIIDNFMIINMLGGIVQNNESLIREMYGYGADVAASAIPNLLWGCFSVTLIFYNLVPLAVQSFSQSAIPDITESHVRGDKDSIYAKVRIVVKMSLLVALPVGIGIMSVADPIVKIFSADTVAETVPILRIMCVAAIFSALCQPVTSILQSIGKYDSPVKVMLIAAVVKCLANLALISVPSLNVKGAALGSCVSYLVLLAILISLLKKYTGIRFNFIKMLIPPLVSAVACGASAYLVVSLLSDRIGNVGALVIAIVLAAVVYFLLSVMTGALGRNEINLLPYGKKIAKVLEMMHILR